MIRGNTGASAESMQNPRATKIALVHWLLIVVIAALLLNVFVQFLLITKRDSWVRSRSVVQKPDAKEAWRKRAKKAIEDELAQDQE